MTVHDVIAWLHKQVDPGANLHLDSRHVREGDVFFACKGRETDGRRYIEHAADRGAAAAVVEAGVDMPSIALPGLPVLVVEGLAALLGSIADEWYGRPSESLKIVAITGTNGKTSTVQWLGAALNREGVACATLGTLGAMLPDGTVLEAELTTPDVVSVHRLLGAMRDAGASMVALEASSIGLDQGRLDGVRIDIAGFTNLTHDHLDYHGSLENYKAAKLALFRRKELRHAVVNVDDAVGAEIFHVLAVPGTGTSLAGSRLADLQGSDVHAGAEGVLFNFTTPDGTAQIVSHVLGEHNVANLLLVAGVLRSLGWGMTRVARALAQLRPVDGRLQIVDAPACRDPDSTGGGLPLVVVDYAHTPDALERVLGALREVADAREGRLICVFGCGGGRDRAKRPIMGRIAESRADVVLVTSDNPRTEDPAAIISDITAGMKAMPVVQTDRARAILRALWTAEASDVVLLAGKGHETWQEIQRRRQVFDDREWARAGLAFLRHVVVSTDTRALAPGELFLALQGERFDGHDYLDQARRAGACAAIVREREPAVDLPQFVLGDTQEALTRIATEWRARFDLPLIAVTGSNGKTTTKEMIAGILRAWHGERFVLATEGNLNNHIGVPLTLLRLRPWHRAAVVELGMNHPGEIAQLAAVAAPTVGLVNNAQREHQEFMHTVEAVARENGAVLQAVLPEGTAVFPGDDVYTGLWSELAQGRSTLCFGYDEAVQVTADDIHAKPTMTLCRLEVSGESAPLVLGVPGAHNLRNALAAAACAHAAGAPLNAVVQGLQAFSPVAGRLQPYRLADGMELIDDTYNANPDSVRAAIDVLAALTGRTIFVLGDMAEVGAQSAQVHAEMGSYAAERGITHLLSFGTASVSAVSAFGDAGRAFQSIEALVAHLDTLRPAHILVKGSRSMRMERVVRALHGGAENPDPGGRHAA